jgi:DNA-binding transcriptional regulator PaaX
VNEKRPYRFLWLDIIRSQVRDGTLTANAGHLALLLAVHYINGSNNEAWPAQHHLAADAGLSEKTVRRALHELEHRGLLHIDRGHQGRTSGNVYQIENR